MPYKRTPSICAVCSKPFMARSKSIACSTTCASKAIRRRTEATNAALIDRNGPIPERYPELGQCWLWTTDRNASGYGYLHRRDEESLAHRRAWIEVTGDVLTTDDVIGHACDKPPCVRNDSKGTYEIDGRLLPRHGHLFKGTQADNAADMVSKRRNYRGNTHHWHTRVDTIRRGEQATGARLTADLVIYLCKRYADGGITYRELSEETGISAMAICRAVRGDSWKHVPRPH